MTIQTITGIANLTLLGVFLWNILDVGWFMLPEKTRESKTRKAAAAMRIFTMLMAMLIITGILAIFIRQFVGTLVIVGMYVGIQLFNLFKKRKRLKAEIEESHRDECVLALSLGTTNKNDRGLPIRLWFKRNGDDWPTVKVEVGISIHSIPVGKITKEIMEEHVDPQINELLTNPKMEHMLPLMKDDFVQAGVVHPIDIEGWDKQPAIKTLIEKVFAAELPTMPKTKHEKQTIIAPTEGWEERSVYLADVSYNDSNPIHRALIFSGFLNDPENAPGGYSKVINIIEGSSAPLSDLRYLKIIRKLSGADDLNGEMKLPRDAEDETSAASEA